MKKLLLFISFFSIQIFAQTTIQLKDGTTITPVENSIHIAATAKKIHYKLPNVDKEQKLKFKDLAAANFGDYRFKSFAIGKQQKAFYILAEANGKTLVTIKTSKVISRGGFESVLDFYELAVLDSDSNSVDQLTFSSNNSDKSSNERAGVIAFIQNHFPHCPKLLEKAKLFESNPSDKNHRMILTFLDVPTYISCE